MPILISVGAHLGFFEGVATQVEEVRCAQFDKRLLPDLKAVGPVHEIHGLPVADSYGGDFATVVYVNEFIAG